MAANSFRLATFVIWLLFAFMYNEGVSSAKPNIVIFLVDDLGIADLGCFGNDSLKTPNVDRLAAEGVKLTHNLSPESLCTPSRAAFLTGRYAIRSGIAPQPGKSRVFLFTSASGGLPQRERTFAKELGRVGYTTGLIGKWHLGVNCKTRSDFCHHPLNHGFHHFYGLPLTNLQICSSEQSVVELTMIQHGSLIKVLAAMTFVLATALAIGVGLLSRKWIFLSLLFIIAVGVVLIFKMATYKLFNCLLMRNFDVVEQPVQLKNLTVRLTADAVNFIQQNANKPFMLLMSYVKVHTALFTTKAFEGHSGHSRYGDNVEEMDWSVGKIMSALERLGLKDDTFVYFTSDHGPHLEEHGLNGQYEGGWKGSFKGGEASFSFSVWGMGEIEQPLRQLMGCNLREGGKANMWEGGIRVPTVVSWPSHLPQGVEISEPTNSFDIFPTVLEIAGAELPKDRVIDGVTLMPLLTQQTNITSHEIMIHYCARAIHAVRYRPRTGNTVWKAHFMTPKFTPGIEGCVTKGFHDTCKCNGDDVTLHKPPLLFDLTEDPSESTPLDPRGSLYQHVINIIGQAVSTHQKTVCDVPNELDMNDWSTSLQVYCNLPWFSCEEDIDLSPDSWPKRIK